ncbi:phosphatidylglycerophosphatase A [Burkholderia oklahomensis]|uniref:phosphatidylglycerophosphatase A family protein n=1 Tax=Burkholderia oklahomensis TaxID=342113 RepID=UPI00016A8D7E|nr:phosphatidylglycerophosphatase A [Burkholderia oklahomensis]AJX32038.1 phosphatidylglycerophosphatase A family protein [Burkholderia oklahomensis C6786]AOI44859.1 phosphatidylglycerophosphatase [Burkholderia oklahomensis C6786]KUY65325.1 phosphatidylglycerophosphatase [Burkholderia oklahomensis C6786]MBI0359113.1 phosphatidylglycerophosphatase A [Burkholderia oklahomensis]SUW57878.1 Phosphatidylglycerophosphatase A [Burkholderia oklahomensis]
MPTDPTPRPADSSGQPGPAPAPQDSQKIARRRATVGFMFSHPVHIVSLGLGSGLAPFMPGTFGTLFGWLTFVALNRYLTVPEWWALIVVGFVAGIWMTGFTAKKMGIADPGPAVWDEIVAIWLVMLLVTPATFVEQLWAFVVFRFFDMVKPPPIRYFDRNLKGGFGIMFDDLIAALMTLFVIALWRSFVE